MVWYVPMVVTKIKDVKAKFQIVKNILKLSKVVRDVFSF